MALGPNLFTGVTSIVVVMEGAINFAVSALGKNVEGPHYIKKWWLRKQP